MKKQIRDKSVSLSTMTRGIVLKAKVSCRVFIRKLQLDQKLWRIFSSVVKKEHFLILFCFRLKFQHKKYNRREVAQITRRVCLSTTHGLLSSSSQTQVSLNSYLNKVGLHLVKPKNKVTQTLNQLKIIKVIRDIVNILQLQERIFKLLVEAITLKKWFLTQCYAHQWVTWMPITHSFSSRLNSPQITRIYWECAHQQLKSKHNYQFRKTKTR